jgi:hypothetical protein
MRKRIVESTFGLSQLCYQNKQMNKYKPTSYIQNPYERDLFSELLNKIQKEKHASYIEHEPKIWYFTPEGKRSFISPDFVIRGKTEQIKIAVELDGRYHENQSAKINDNMRDFTLKTMGYEVLRFSSDDWNNHKKGCIQQIKNTLERLEYQAILSAQNNITYKLTQTGVLNIAA